MKKRLRWQLLALAVFTLVVGVLAYPREGQLLQFLGIDSQLSVQRGLDLQGGVYLVYQAQIPEEKDPQKALKQVTTVIEKRVNPGGASEAIVQTADNNRVVVQLPDVDDPQAAIERIGRTAQLEFLEVDRSAESRQQQLKRTSLSGEDVAEANPGFNRNNQPVVNLQLDSGESTEKFAQMTRRIFNNGNQLLILLDQQPVFGPGRVSQPILTGRSTLTGMQSIQEAEEVATLLNAGALPVPIELAAQQTIGPTLGAEATTASVIAGIIGLLSLVIFMLVVYRVGGAVAVAAMGVYTATTVTVFKLSALPLFGGYTIVLTLAGIAGFIMSVAVASDANILVMERLREERQAGMKPIKAVESGFDHAWNSIRDASVATLIISIILYYLAARFGETSIQGFALVLGVGVAINLASVSMVTRTLLRAVARSRKGDKI